MKSMRLGLSTYACTWAINAPKNPMDAIGFLHCAHNHGFSLVQIADNIPLGNLSAAQLEHVHQTALELVISVEVGIRGLTDANMETYIRICQQMEAPLLRIVADSDSYHPTKEQIIQSLRIWEPVVREKGIVLGLENHDRFSCRDLRFIMESVASPFVGICLDTVNSFGAMEGPAYVIEMLAPFVVNIHVKDFRIFRPSHMLGFVLEGTAAGEGKLDIVGLLANPYIQNRPQTTAILELWVSPQSTVEATIETEQQWIARSRANIGHLFEL